MRRFGGAIVALGLVAMLAAPALAQQGKGQGQGGRRGGGFGMGGPGLVTIPAVQEELKITDEQKGKLEEVTATFREEMQGLREKLADVPQGERMSRMRELMTEVNAKGHKELETILKPEQMKRFKEIELQARGVEAFADKEVHKALSVTEEQAGKIETALSELNEKRRTIFQDAQGDFQAAMGKVRELQTETREKVMGLLKDDQKAKYKELTGEPFDLPVGGPGGPGGGGGGRRPGGNVIN